MPGFIIAILILLHCSFVFLVWKTETVLYESTGYTSDVIENNSDLGPVSRKSRNFTGHFRVSQFPLYLKNGEDLIRQLTSQLFFFLLP